MKSNYKRLGNYIKEVNLRNKDLEGKTLLGVSIQKVLMPSIANIIGTDMSTYKIIRKDQFAYGPVTSRNGDKISVALLTDYEEAIISQAYTSFEITDTAELLPEYLMMWFRRSEFDRYTRFMSHGSAREVFGWEEMCNVGLPVPDIEKQKEIVNEYKVITDRIERNKDLIKTLEKTAKAIYKQWFIYFEFPNENGQPYKSSGGKMVYNEELAKDLPKDWKYEDLGANTIITAGGDKPKIFSDTEKDNYKIPIYSNSTFNEGLFGYTNEAKVFKKSITISARGGIGYTSLRIRPFVPIVRLIVIIPKYEYQLNYLFNCVNNFEYDDVASAQGQLTIPDISSYKVIIPESEILKKYQKINFDFIRYMDTKKTEIQKLEKLKNIVLSEITKVELFKIEQTI